MGQQFSSEEGLSHMKDLIGSVLYDAMLEAGAVSDLRVIHPVLLASQDEEVASQACLKEQLKQLQVDIGNRVPTYLRDLISRLTTFSDEPRVAGLVGLVVTMVMDMVYTSSKQSAGVKGKSAGSSSCQHRVCELQEVMEEYLKRCRISLSDKSRLIQDSIRLEAQLSLTLTQLKTCLLGGDCDSRTLRHWASGASFHTQMLVHLARLEGKAEPVSAQAALEQYREDLKQIVAAYRRYKSKTVCVVKSRGGLPATCDPPMDVPEEGAMTGLTVTDRETGKSVTIPLSSLETETERRLRASGPYATSAFVSSAINFDLITSDQYSQAYLDHLFSAGGQVAELENYFSKASERLRMLRSEQSCSKKMENVMVYLQNHAEGFNEEPLADKGKTEMGGRQGDIEDGRRESLKLSIVETQPEESLSNSQPGASP
ncbi:uncharacterized protein KZ484_011205 [Pholidichthys leucotaenia]